MRQTIKAGAVLGLPDYPAKGEASFIIAYYVPPLPGRESPGWQIEETTQSDDPIPVRFWPTCESAYTCMADSVRAGDYGIGVVLHVSHLPVPGPAGHDARGLPLVVVMDVETHPLLRKYDVGPTVLDAAPLLTALSSYYVNGEGLDAPMPTDLENLTAEMFSQDVAIRAAEVFKEMNAANRFAEAASQITPDEWKAATKEKAANPKLITLDNADPRPDPAAPPAETTAETPADEAARLKAENRRVVYGKE